MLCARTKLICALEKVYKNAYCPGPTGRTMKTREFRRWLERKGVSFVEGANHTKLYLNGRQSTLPRHAGEIAEGLRRAILKQLGL